MKPFPSKVVLLFALYASLQLLEACFNNCKCAVPELPFFDYHAILAETPDVAIAAQEKFVLGFGPDESTAEFIALQRSRPCFSLFTPLLACDCERNGDAGDKFPLTQLEITADRPFNDTLAAGDLLNGLFEVQRSNSVIPLSDGTQPPFTKFSFPQSRIEIQTAARPNELNVPYHFMIRITKENGEVLSALSLPVVFI